MITFKNGNKEITVTITGQTEWTKEDQSRIYFDLVQSNKRTPIHKLYEVISGTTRDETIDHNGRKFAFEFGIDCNSHSKRAAATAAVTELVATI